MSGEAEPGTGVSVTGSVSPMWLDVRRPPQHPRTAPQCPFTHTEYRRPKFWKCIDTVLRIADTAATWGINGRERKVTVTGYAARCCRHTCLNSTSFVVWRY
jgi:hypothetical protein